MGWDYSEKTKRIFLDAVQGKPGTHLGEIENPDGFGEHGSIACGDALRFTFRVLRSPDPLKDVIVDARYLTFGCTSAIAASEALCALIEQGGYTPVHALSITNRDIVDYLEGLPEQKIHCSVMGAEALEAAVFNWAHKRGVDLASLGIDVHRDEQDEGRIVCQCFTLTEPYIRRKIRELGLRTIPEITGAIKAGGACMSCHHVPGGLQDILDEVWGRRPTTMKNAVIAATSPARALDDGGAAEADRPQVDPDAAKDAVVTAASGAAAISPFQFSKKVERCLDEYVRPMLRKDGGDLELLDIKETLVYCRLLGHCAGCAASNQTLRFMVERTLKDMVDERIRVITA
jgi:NifU-like protein